MLVRLSAFPLLLVALLASPAYCERPPNIVYIMADVLPTVAELAAADAPQDIDGMSIVPELLGEKIADCQPAPTRGVASMLAACCTRFEQSLR